MTDAWVPSTTDVARWVARLTGTGNAGLALDFTADTVPTDAQVAAIVDQATAEVRVSVGVGADSKYDPWIRALVAMEAAAQIVLSYDPGATDAATLLHTWYETGLTRLMALAHPEVSTGGGSSTQPIVGYVGTPGDIEWSMPIGPLEWPNSVYARPFDQFDLWWLGPAPFPPSFRNV